MGSLLALDRAILGVTYPDASGPFVRAVAGRLEAHGWSVRREVAVTDRGDGHAGRVDIVAHLPGPNGGTVAIECDSRSPRRKSIRKLQQVRASLRIVLLRSREGEKSLGMRGCAHVIGLEVSP